MGGSRAVELSTGNIKWETTLGFLPWLKDRPEARKWGSFGLGGAILTATGLAFIANTLDGHLRAFDTSNGQQLWERALPVPGLATPMTYQSASGRQYVVISAGGHAGLGTPTGDYVVAFSLQ
jgi:quinoprotein glucose dehydrogenase